MIDSSDKKLTRIKNLMSELFVYSSSVSVIFCNSQLDLPERDTYNLFMFRKLLQSEFYQIQFFSRARFGCCSKLNATIIK